MMKSTITIIILFLLITNCRKETSQSTEYVTNYVNNSAYNIKIKNLEPPNIEIMSGQTHQESHSVRGLRATK